MKNLIFLLWMILYPIATEVASYIHWKSKMAPQGESQTWVAIFELIIWGGVGYLLYNNG